MISPEIIKKYNIMKTESVIFRNACIHIFIHYIYIYTYIQIHAKIMRKTTLKRSRRGRCVI